MSLLFKIDNCGHPISCTLELVAAWVLFGTGVSWAWQLELSSQGGQGPCCPSQQQEQPEPWASGPPWRLDETPKVWTSGRRAGHSRDVDANDGYE